MIKVDWHPFPKEKPKKDGEYLVTCVGIGGEFVEKLWWQKKLKNFYNGISFWTNVIAWAELPKPYKQPKPLDMHPDAITARKYAEGDPETVKSLHIFDE